MTNEHLIITLLIINLVAICGVLGAILGDRKMVDAWLSLVIMKFCLVFYKKITIRPTSGHFSPYQSSEHFYLLKVIKCSHQRYFKIVSGTYTTIVPESDVLLINDNPIR